MSTRPLIMYFGKLHGKKYNEALGENYSFFHWLPELKRLHLLLC